MQQKRTRVWIDRFQTVLFWRIAFYFLFYQIGVWSLVIIEWNISDTLFRTFGPTVAGGVMLFLASIVIGIGFLFIYDAVKFAHRIVGPLVRFRQVCRAIRDGEEIDLIKLREGDYLDEFRDELNEMLKALEKRGAIALKPGDDGATQLALSGDTNVVRVREMQVAPGN